MLRSFVLISAALVTMLISLPLLVACGGNGEKITPTTTPDLTETTDLTGTLTMAVEFIGNDRNLTPFKRNMGNVRSYVNAMADYLVYVDHDSLGYTPGLAEEWDISPDRTNITFKLREGVQFHKGWGEVTAEDVQFTIETALDPVISDNHEAQNVLDFLDRIEVSGRYQLTIYTRGAFAELLLPYLSPDRTLALPITSKTYFEQVGFTEASTSPIYSGPYEFDGFTVGNQLRMKAVGEHWRTIPEFRNILIREVPEMMTRVAMIYADEADIAQITFDQAVNLEAQGYGVVTVPGAYQIVMPLFGQWFTSRSTYDPDLPWLDIRVREAMNLAVNREDIVEFLFYGNAKPTFGIIPYDPSWVMGLESYEYDPDRARQLLADAGYANGFKLKLLDVTIVNRVPEMYEVLLAVASDWENVGLKVEIENANIMAVYGDIITRNTTGNSMGMTFADYGIYSGAYTVVMHSQEGSFPMYESEQTDEWINDWLAATTPEEKNAFAEQITRYIHDEFVSVPIVKADAVWSFGDGIGDWHPFNLVNLNLEYITHP